MFCSDPKPVSTIDCNFDNGVGDCGYTQRQDDDRGWILANGTSPINSTGTGKTIQDVVRVENIVQDVVRLCRMW